MTARTAVAAMAGSFAWHLQAQHPPRLPMGTVPILDMIELRNRGAQLLFRAQRLLAPLAKGILPAANAMSAWTEWGPAAGGGVRVSFCPSRHQPGRGVPRFRHTARLVACNSQSTRMSGSCSLRGNRYRGSKRGSRRRVISRILHHGLPIDMGACHALSCSALAMGSQCVSIGLALKKTFASCT